MPTHDPLTRSFTGRPGRLVVIAILITLSAFGWVRRAVAEENRILTMTKDALYGGATGLLLGGVLTLVVDSHNRDDVIRWGVVVGTFTGFAYGVYDVSHRPKEFSFRNAPACAAGKYPRPAPVSFSAAEGWGGTDWSYDRSPRSRALGRPNGERLPGSGLVSAANPVTVSPASTGGLHAN